MLSLTVNGKGEKLNIGCRTFISLSELLHQMEVSSSETLNVHINTRNIEPHDFLKLMVSSGDNVTIKTHK